MMVCIRNDRSPYSHFYSDLLILKSCSNCLTHCTCVSASWCTSGPKGYLTLSPSSIAVNFAWFVILRSASVNTYFYKNIQNDLLSILNKLSTVTSSGSAIHPSLLPQVTLCAETTDIKVMKLHTCIGLGL